MSQIPQLIRTIQPPRQDTDGNPICALCDEVVQDDAVPMGYHANSQLAVMYALHPACAVTIRNVLNDIIDENGYTDDDE